MKALFLVLLSLVPGFAQMPGPIVIPVQLFPQELSNYLGLSQAQQSSIIRLNTDYNRVVSEKSFRAAQVQREIAEWTNKDPIEPIQLGLRYAELENIQREIRAALADTRQKTVAVLDAAQKAKLKLLEDAMKLQPVISQAQCENLLVPAQTQPFPGNIIPANRVAQVPIIAPGQTGFASFLLGSPSICGPIFVNGDFQPAPVQP